MHHNRSLLPGVEVLLGVMVKTSRYSTKLLFVILNFSHENSNDQNAEFWAEFIISTELSVKFNSFNQRSDFQLKESQFVQRQNQNLDF